MGDYWVSLASIPNIYLNAPTALLKSPLISFDPRLTVKLMSHEVGVVARADEVTGERLGEILMNHAIDPLEHEVEFGKEEL